MIKRGRLQKILGLLIAGSLIALIFTILLPPTMAIHLDTGDFTPSSGIKIGDDVNFSEVTITIRGIERIPLTELNFSIFQAGTHQEQYNIKFNAFGNATSGDMEKFVVKLISPTITQLSNWITNGIGYDYDYGERWGNNTGDGYGYGDAFESNITLIYRIIFTTQSIGTYFGKLFATASLNGFSYVYESDPSSNFMVGSSLGGRPARSPQPLILVCSQETLSGINNALGLHLVTPFYAKDSDGDNLVDEFTDPNGILASIRSVRDGAKILFLLSSDGDKKPNLLWNSADDTFLVITNITGTIVETQINTIDETITVFVNVDKDGWIYIEVTDLYADYQEYTYSVHTTSGRVIASEYIWRENGKIYFLDDPAIQYKIIYNYDILDPLFSPADGSEFEDEIPQITITYYEQVSIITCSLNGKDISNMLSTSDQKTYTFNPSNSVGTGVYELSITVEDREDNTRTSSSSYVVNLPYSSYVSEEFPWLLIAIFAIILIIAAIIVILKLFVFY
jgi:hypothetical protein